MADNYLEKKMEEWQQKPLTSSRKAVGGLAKLLLKNRSYRGYDPRFVVRADQLQRIIEVNSRIPSARNQQVLRFLPVLTDEAHKVLPHIKLGGALPHLHLPFPGTEPRTFIVICSTIPEDRYVSVDLGISAQSMLLQAVEIGLNGICIGAFDKEALRRELKLPLEPLLVLAIGRGAEEITLKPISADESHAYYRDEKGRHYVPKLRTEELILKREEE